MADYIGVPLETNPDDISNTIFDQLEAQVPGWVPSDGAMDTRLISAFAGIAAETRDLASNVTDAIFAAFGSSFMNLPQIQGAQATMLSTWTARDSTGYTIPQGTLVQGTDSLGIVRFWSTYQDYTIAPSATTVSGVILVAQDEGVDANNITYLTGQIVLVDDLEFISGLVSNSSSGGGSDAEDDDAYLNRLRNDLQLLTPRPILPDDFSVLAMTQAGVARAVTIDGYNTADSSFGNERMVTVFVSDASGNDPGSTVRTNLATYLESLRESTFIVNVSFAEHVEVNVTYSVVASPGFDHTDLMNDINAALTAFLDPATWGTPTLGDSPAWINTTKVYFFAIASIIQDTVGVSHLVSLLIANAASDMDLTASGGPVPLAEANILAGTIS